jgi:hypothetical protein
MIREGWKCPQCGAILNPDVQACPFCAKTAPVYPTTFSPTAPWKPWERPATGDPPYPPPHIIAVGFGARAHCAGGTA